MNNFEIIIERIKTRREELGLTYQDLADRTNLHKSTLQRYETGAIKNIPLSRLESLAKGLNVSPAYLMGWDEISLPSRTVKIPILGSVPAGMPVEAVTDIVGDVEIDEALTLSGEYFALKIQGDSMSPKIEDGDVVIVRKQCEVENGEIGIVFVNDYEATCKRVFISDTGIILQPINPNHKIQTFNLKEQKRLPVVVLGKVIESRRFF